jgi:hypothetical protein
VCGISAIRTDLRVSLQARGSPDPVQGNIAAGVLADSNLVVVPNPPPVLLDDSVEFDVWIIPVPVSPEKSIEVNQPLKKNFLGHRSRPGRPTVVYLELAHRSIYASQIGRCDGGELGRLLREHDGDTWQALIDVGAISADLAAGVSADTLRAAEDAARRQRRPRRSDMEFDSYEDLGVAFCWPWVCFCRNTAETDFGSLAAGGSDEAAG